MSTTHKRKAASFQYADDKIEFRPLGSGQEVGRSCHILKLHGKTIMLDCGVHPAYGGVNSLPFFDYIEMSSIDLLLISHFHLDHVAALPYLMKKDGFRAAVYMTHPTKSITQLMLEDFIKVTAFGKSDDGDDRYLFNERDLRMAMSQVQVINFHEVKNVLGIRFWCYYAGHVLGAAMFMIEVGSTRVLYTGDYSRSEDRHLPAAELPTDVDSIDLLIVEGTHGVQQHTPMPEREAMFTRYVQDTVRAGGKCLIPQFALGSAQELLLILEEHWRKTPFLRHVPIYFTSALAKRCLSVYQRYTTFMNHRIRELALKGRNPFDFQHVTCLNDIRSLDPMEPCVIIASPGMLQNGLSRSIFAEWCHDARNTVIIAGYCVEGTLAYELQTKPPKKFTRDDGHQVNVELGIRVVPFTAHSDYNETRDFIQQLLPNNILIVHGNSNQVEDLQKALKDIPTLSRTNIEAPQNGVEVEITLSKPKLVKTLGGVPLNSHTRRMMEQEHEYQQEELRKQLGKSASNPVHGTNVALVQPQQPYLKFSSDENEPEEGTIVNGLLMKNESGFQLLSPAEFISFMPNEVNLVQQTISVTSTLPIATIINLIGGTFEVSGVVEHPTNSSVTFKVMNTVTVTAIPEKLPENYPPTKPGSSQEDSHCYVKRPQSSAVVTYRVHWVSDSVADIISDAVISLITSAQLNPSAAKILGGQQAYGCCSHSHSHSQDSTIMPAHDQPDGSSTKCGQCPEHATTEHESANIMSSLHTANIRSFKDPWTQDQIVTFMFDLQMAYGVQVVPSLAAFQQQLYQYLQWQYRQIFHDQPGVPPNTMDPLVMGSFDLTSPHVGDSNISFDVQLGKDTSAQPLHDPTLIPFYQLSSHHTEGNYLVYLDAARWEDAKFLFFIDNNIGFIHPHNMSVTMLDRNSLAELASDVAGDDTTGPVSTEGITHADTKAGTETETDTMSRDKKPSLTALLHEVDDAHNSTDNSHKGDRSSFVAAFQQLIQKFYSSLFPVSRHRFMAVDDSQPNQAITMRTKGGEHDDDDDDDDIHDDDEEGLALVEGSFFTRSNLARINAD